MVCSKTFQRRQRISWINFDSNEERHLHTPQQNNNRDSIHNLCKWSFDFYTFRHTLFPFMWYMYHSKLNIIYINLHKSCNCGKMSQQNAKWIKSKKKSLFDELIQVYKLWWGSPKEVQLQQFYDVGYSITCHSEEVLIFHFNGLNTACFYYISKGTLGGE